MDDLSEGIEQLGKAQTLWGLPVEMDDRINDNLIAILAENRAGLAVPRPAAFQAIQVDAPMPQDRWPKRWLVKTLYWLDDRIYDVLDRLGR